MLTATTENLTASLLAELQCRTGSVLIAALVEDYGVGAKDALRQLRRSGLVRLVAAGSLAIVASLNDMTIDQLQAGSIEGDGEWFVEAEMRS
jgi:hypothetical protein